MNNPVCPDTGAPLVRGTRPLTLTYRDQSVVLIMPGWYRDGSDEGVHTGDDMKVSDRALNLLKAHADGLLAPADIKRIRRKLKLTQAMAGALIGGGPRAFQKYEAGDLLPSRAISSALTLLDRDPTGLAVLGIRSARTAPGDFGRILAKAGTATATPGDELPDGRSSGHA